MPRALGALDRRLGVQGAQRHRHARRAHEERIAVGHENRVVSVVAGSHQALAVLHAEQAVACAEIPASRPLEQVAPQRGHVADLRRPDFERRLPERRVCPANSGIRHDVGQPGPRADRQSARLGVAGDSGQVLDVLQIDHAIRRGNVVFHPADQVGAAGEGRRAGRSQERDSLIDRGGGCVLKGFHGSRLPFSGCCGQGVQGHFEDSSAIRSRARRWRWSRHCRWPPPSRWLGAPRSRPPRDL